MSSGEAQTKRSLGAGGALFWRTNVAHRWESGRARAAWRADYERAYRPPDALPQPSIVAVRAQVDLFPSRRRAELSGAYVLENREARPIDTLWVVMPRDAEAATVTVDGAQLARHDARFGVHVFEVRSPLAPGARTELRFTVALDRGGIRAGGFGYDVAGNGTYLTHTGAFPMLGYRAGFELDDPAARREHGLEGPPTAVPPWSALGSLSPARRNTAWLTLDATVSTEADQTALAPSTASPGWHLAHPRPARAARGGGGGPVRAAARPRPDGQPAADCRRTLSGVTQGPRALRSRRRTCCRCPAASR
ncbi:MAG TPA: hypothetical protein VK447_21075 [Myxococcaceae bacterium]|nr:hypothetical protein [Myxococcaceae bacterium]